VALLASSAACGKDEATPGPAGTPDAGLACEAGSEGCACVFGSGCQDGLLCIARRCLIPDETPDMSAPQVPRPPPILPAPAAPEPATPDGGSPPAPPDAGDSPLDAGSLPDAATDGG
jgi:hypothetical protein